MDNEINIIHFDMGKNEKKELTTDDDYYDWAEGCYELANEFYNLAFTCKEQGVSYFIAYSTNIAFGCELYLKALLLNDKIDCRKKHNLYELFSKLSNEVKTQVKNLHRCGNINRDNFETELRDVSEAFTILRYIYERKGMAFNYKFLLEFLITLHEITRLKF